MDCRVFQPDPRPKCCWLTNELSGLCCNGQFMEKDDCCYIPNPGPQTCAPPSTSPTGAPTCPECPDCPARRLESSHRKNKNMFLFLRI